MATTPRVSVIVPVYNDPEGITDTLDSLAGQTYPADEYEIIVVDEGAGSVTRRAIDRVAGRTDIDVRPITEPPAGTRAAARNEGIRQATGGFLFFLDADIVVPSSWIEDCVDTMDQSGALYASCNIVPADRDAARRTLAGRFELSHAFDIQQQIEHDHFASTAALITRRELFDRIGRFDPDLVSSEDREFGQRVHKAGIEQHFFGDITVYHPTRTQIAETLQRQFRLGYGDAQEARRHGRVLDNSLGDPMTYLPGALPWNARQWASVTLSERDGQSPFLVILGLYLYGYCRDLANAAGRIKARVELFRNASDHRD